MEKLADGFMLMSVSLSIPSGVTRIRELEEEAKNKHNMQSSDRVRSTLNLFDTDMLKEVRKIHSRTRAIFNSSTLPFYDMGFRLIENKDVQRMISLIDDAKIEASKPWSDFISSYEDHVSNDRVKLGDLWDRSLYPSVEELKAAHSIDYTLSVVPDPNHDVRAGWDDETRESFVKRAKEKERKNVKRIFMSMLERAYQSISHVEDRMKSYSGKRSGSFRDSLIDNVRDVSDMIDKYNFNDDEELMAIKKKIDNEICRYDPSALRESEYLRESVAKSAAELLPRIGSFGKKIMEAGSNDDNMNE